MADLVPIDLHSPTPADGFDIHRLVASSPPLDTNSLYCNLLQCTHFADTSVCAKSEEVLVGFVSGYRIPSRPDTLFIWQIAVSRAARGRGLATRMIEALLRRPACREVEFIETTIASANKASEALFRRLAEKLGAATTVGPGFERHAHFRDAHEAEPLWRIGPIPRNTSTKDPHENL